MVGTLSAAPLALVVGLPQITGCWLSVAGKAENLNGFGRARAVGAAKHPCVANVRLGTFSLAADTLPAENEILRVENSVSGSHATEGEAMNDDTRAPVLPQVHVLTGGESGPVVTVLGGVHGDEYEGVLAVRRLAARIEPGALRGTIRLVAPAHPAAWAASSRNGPVDDLNLARVFPGRADGTPTEQVAHYLTTEAIAGADVLIDLHSGGFGFDMPLLAGYHAGQGELSARSGELAAVFGAPLLWQHPEAAAGRSLSAATALGVASLYVEGRGGGQVRREDLDCYVDGLLRVLGHLGMIDGAPAPARSVAVRGDGNTDGGITAPCAGYFVTSVQAGSTVSEGQTLGEIFDERGAAVAAIPSPLSGVVMLVRRGTRVESGDTLAIVAAYVEEQ